MYRTPSKVCVHTPTHTFVDLLCRAWAPITRVGGVRAAGARRGAGVAARGGLRVRVARVPAAVVVRREGGAAAVHHVHGLWGQRRGGVLTHMGPKMPEWCPEKHCWRASDVTLGSEHQLKCPQFKNDCNWRVSGVCVCPKGHLQKQAPHGDMNSVMWQNGCKWSSRKVKHSTL